MRQSKAKALRKKAKELALNEQSVYTEGFAYASGVKHSIKTNVRLQEDCLRAIYKSLKSKSKQSA